MKASLQERGGGGGGGCRASGGGGTACGGGQGGGEDGDNELLALVPLLGVLDELAGLFTVVVDKADEFTALVEFAPEAVLFAELFVNSNRRPVLAATVLFVAFADRVLLMFVWIDKLVPLILVVLATGLHTSFVAFTVPLTTELFPVALAASDVEFVSDVLTSVQDKGGGGAEGGGGSGAGGGDGGGGRGLRQKKSSRVDAHSGSKYSVAFVPLVPVAFVPLMFSGGGGVVM